MGEKAYKMTQVTSSKHWSPVLLDTLQTLQKDFHFPQTGSSYRRWGWIHHLAEVVHDVWVDVGCYYERRAHLTPMPLLPKGWASHWVPKVLQWLQSTAAGTLGNLSSHLCWVWLAGSGWEYTQGLPQQMRQRGATSNIYNIYWTSSSHHIITTPLHTDWYISWFTGLQVYTSV